MTSTTLQYPQLAKEVKNVNSALRDLALATRRLVSALFTVLLQRHQPSPQETARQQADKLRAYADNLHRADPRYVEDLYAAANRHEAAASER